MSILFDTPRILLYTQLTGKCAVSCARAAVKTIVTAPIKPKET
jgi:hypothetical protein